MLLISTSLLHSLYSTAILRPQTYCADRTAAVGFAHDNNAVSLIAIGALQEVFEGPGVP